MTVTTKKRGLGRNLDALLTNYNPIADEGGKGPGKKAESSAKERLTDVDVTTIEPGRYQPRQTMDQEPLESLAESIKSQGVIQPIVIRPVSSDRYEIIAGERRWRASQLAGLKTIPAIIKQVPDEAAIAVALIENIQRENLNPIEEAMALSRLGKEFELTHEEIAKTVSRARTSVSNLLRLLDLDPSVKEMLQTGKLEMGHGRALLSLTKTDQFKAAMIVREKQLSVRETEKLVKQWGKSSQSDAQPTSSSNDPNLSHLERNLSEKIGAKIQIQAGKKDKGKIIIHYHNLDELEGIIDHFS